MASRRISFTSDGYKLAGHLFISAGNPKKLAFLFIQGWQGHQNLSAAETLANLNHICMTYDMRGHGESEGDISKFSRADFTKDATIAYDYLKQQINGDVAIGAVGSSFGSYTAILLSEKREVCCLSLRVPATYPNEGYNEPHLAKADPDNFVAWRMKKLGYSENHACKILHDFKGKVQIIEAEADEIVPSQAPKNYAEAVANRNYLAYEVMKNAPHRLANDKLQAEYEKLLIEWVEKL
jgi:esterase/lipase